MPESDLYRLFKETGCAGLSVYSGIKLSAKALKKLRASLGGQRKKFPFKFAMTYPSHGKERIGWSAVIEREPLATIGLSLTWGLVSSDPPKEYGRLSDVLLELAEIFGERDAGVSAGFVYAKERASSLFKRIPLADQAAIFDEIVGFAGIKKDPKGKLLYRLEVKIGEKELRHNVVFLQSVRLSEEMGSALLQSASRISSLALRPKEGE